LKSSLLLSFVLYSAYGVRTIGIALLAALVLGDIAKFRRPSRFLTVTVLVTLGLIIAQSVLFTSPRGYIGALHFSPRMMLTNAVYYSKTLSYVWQNGFSKNVQIMVALFFTALAAVRFITRLRMERSAREFYLLIYMAILVTWSAEIGLRGLLPVLPLYFAYGFEGLHRICTAAGRLGQPAILCSVMLLAGGSYAGEFKEESKRPAEPNVADRDAQEMFSFLRNETQKSEVVIFAKPRILALFTGRNTASLSFDESAKDSASFMRNVNATIMVQGTWSPPSWKTFLDANQEAALVFGNPGYQVFRINWRKTRQESR
jgi:hypothetical protein